MSPHEVQCQPVCKISELPEDRLRAGCSPQSLCRALTYAGARRMARFHLKNEGAWHAVANLYSYAHALYRAFEISPSAELLRGIFHGAVVCTHLRWLNMPAARIPRRDETAGETWSGPAEMLERGELLSERDDG
ncbi:MAG: hypothetical protein O2923_07445 [Verrucomicrobia bacterium]|nr:hypothetical protein [Verrucomicrobiota bacterium]MDA1086967.1 hypothetical protein [Verrucomicrobiota bacterium]